MVYMWYCTSLEGVGSIISQLYPKDHVLLLLLEFLPTLPSTSLQLHSYSSSLSHCWERELLSLRYTSGCMLQEQDWQWIIDNSYTSQLMMNTDNTILAIIHCQPAGVTNWIKSEHWACLALSPGREGPGYKAMSLLWFSSQEPQQTI